MPTTASHTELIAGPATLAEIAAAVGTPAYVYSARAIRAAYAELSAGLSSVPHRIHYALKANSTLAIARLLRELGAGADANSAGEIEVALRAGFAPGDIIFTGVGKRPDELERAVALGIRAINAESEGELRRVAAMARARGTTARIALRINPDIDAGSHPHISTGRRINKFGVPIEDAGRILGWAAREPGLFAAGLHVHVGSQITSLDPLTRAGKRIAELARELRTVGVPLEHLDLGGGLGIPYDREAAVPGRTEYARALASIAAGAGLTLLVEPGRTLVGASGLLLTRVVDVKSSESGPRFAVLDAGMTELMRPALYGAYHRIVAVAPRAGKPLAYDVVGPICESSDVFGRDRMLPPLEPGDLVAVLDAGAYASAMGSTYNRRPLPAEVMVDAQGWRVIRRRQTIDDMLALED
ncbi:MAG TPA: diaminopimelate decarboxylase [Vicinamibacterales bacterium]|nr:diaminopimelate decarboxylase [Vicinamibacterales bacterium]